MASSSSALTKKRGRPRKYESAEQKRTAHAQRRRNQRQEAQATTRNAFFDEYYSAGLLTNANPSIAPIPGIGAPSVSRELEALLPPLSPGLTPVELEEHNVQADEPPLDLDSFEAVASPAPEISIQPSLPTSYEPPHIDNESNLETRGPTPTTPEDREDICTLARALADQLYQHHGCCRECHEQARAAHHETHSAHTGLGEYVDQININGDFPDIYCGINPQEPDESPTHLCVAADHRPNPSLGVTVDIDSVGGFVSSLAVARRGIRWHPTQMAVSDLQSSLHLDPISVQYFDSTGQAHHVRRPVHQVPHYTFGRLIGFEDLSLYLLFPRLYREDQQSSRLLDQDFQPWMDEILLPIINRCYSGDLIQHYPSSFDHSRLNATARGVEMRSQREQILEATHRPGFHQFEDLKILIKGKNLKTLTKADILADLMTGFQQHWQNAVNEDVLAEPFFYDLGKETCLTTASERERPPQSLLWRRCCLNAYSQWIHSKQPADAPHALQHFYPISMLEDTGSLTLETRQTSPQRRAGLYYSQFYASVKEVFAAGNIYPFTNTAMETLALDPQLRKTWQTVGGGLSHNPIALNRAYLTTKQRCHAALQGSVPKVFGLREEHRVSRALFRQILYEFQTRQQFTTRFLGSGDRVEYYYALPTSTLLRWFRWNINKFCVGFEMVYSLNDRHFVTWEHTRVMLMFLRCLPFSYSGGLLERVSGCWRDVWFRPDPTQPDGLRRCEGLGFQRNMQQFGYGWFLDKLDWEMMVFRQPATQYIQFNNLSLQAAYHARYSQVRDMTEFSSIPLCQEYLQKYLRQLCLRAFRKDIFTQIKALLKPESSHWMLPYPQNNSFMRKSKESGQVMWWSSVHRGLDLPSQPSLAHLDYTITPEQRLLHLSDSELYQQLTEFRTQWLSAAPSPSLSGRLPSRLIFEVQERVCNSFSPITGPRRRRHATLPDYFSDTEPEGPADSNKQTSDEEGIEPQKARLIFRV
ncbi:hypothetical protein BJX96DRAFT_183344 [Aspergillus floccosus]